MVIRSRPEYPEGLFEQNGFYTLETFKKDMVIIQHDPSLKVPLTEMFRDQGHQIIQTDLNYTGMIWKDTSVMCLLNLNMNGIQCIFMPFKIRRWSHKIPLGFITTNALKDEIMWNVKYLPAIVEKFRNRELFGHLNLSCLRIGVRVHCFWGEANRQASKVKTEFCWILQFEALRNRLCWHVNNFQSNENCDITLIATISEKCVMNGIEIRRPQTRIPGEITIDGVNLMWPFINIADTIRAVNYHRGDDFQIICILTHKRAIAAFSQVKTKKVQQVNGTNVEVEEICWLPLKWELDKIHELRECLIPSKPNIDLTNQIRVAQQFFRHINTINSLNNGGTVADSHKWIA